MSHGGEMDWFRVTLHLADATGERFQLMEALVDAGASYTWIPRDVLEGLDAPSRPSSFAVTQALSRCSARSRSKGLDSGSTR